MNCVSCGSGVPTGAAFCAQCGAKVVTAPSSEFVADQTSPALSNPPHGAEEHEENLWEGGYSAKAMVGSWLLGVVVSIGLIVAAVMFPQARILFVILIGAVWLGLIVNLAYRKLNIHYKLTTQRFVHRKGILTRRTDRIEVIDIDDVTFQQGLVQQMLQVGTIKITSSDRTHPELVLLGIDNVKQVADLIDDARRKERRKRGLHIEQI